MNSPARKPDLRVVQAPKTDQELPHDEQRELALLAAIITDSRVLDLVLDLVSAEDFYDKQRATIYDAMVQIHVSGESISRAALVSWLRDRGKLTQAGGPVAIGRLDTDVPIIGHAVEHARRIALKAKRRAFILECEALAVEGRGDVGDEAEWLDTKTKQLRKHADKLQPSNAISLRKSFESFFQKLQKLLSNRGGIAGYPTGLKELDKLTAGWHGGHVTLISGETSAGKSAFAVCQAINVASAPQVEVVEVDGQQVDVTVPIGVVFFTLEMEHEEVSQRVLCGLARVNWNLIETGEIGARDLQELAGAAEIRSKLPILIDADRDLTMNRLEAKVARAEAIFAAMGVRLGLVLVDYFQLVDVRSEGDGKNATRESMFNNAGRRLGGFASRFKARPKALPIVNGQVIDAGYLEPSRVAFGVLVQLNDDGNVRECKALEMHAPNHWLIEAPKDEPEGPGCTTRAKIKLKKQRGGKKNAVATCFRHDAYTLFSDDER